MDEPELSLEQANVLKSLLNTRYPFVIGRSGKVTIIARSPYLIIWVKDASIVHTWRSHRSG